MEIQLLPEFGWLVDNVPVYGPGSVFQGFIRSQFSKNQLSKSDRLRIVFHATETIYQSGFRDPVYKNQLFGSQKILWKRQEESEQSPFKQDSETSIPFMIQLPMVQFPPQAIVTSDGKEMSYYCEYILSAYLEDINGKPIFRCHKPVVYMPYVETSISKKLVCISSQPHTLPSSSTKNRIQPSFEVRLPSKDFPLGEVIPITLVLCHISNDSIDMVHARFYQIQTWHRSQAHTGQPKKEYRKFRHLISQNTKKITSDDHNNTNTLKIDLCLQDISLPTFTYGSVFSITYVLEVTVKQKGIWSRRLEVADIPIRLGTLGYCSKAPENMQVYSAFRSVFESSQDSQVALSVPRFVEVIEYEEALPLYVDERPPSYTSIAHSFLQNCVM